MTRPVATGLIVDDEPQSRKLLEALLRPEGMRAPGVRFSLALLALGCVLPIAVMMGLFISGYYEREQAHLSESAISRARAMVSSVDREFASAEAALHALVTSPFLAQDDLAGFHAQALQALPNIGAVQILLFDARKRIIFSTHRPFGETMPDAPTPPALQRLFESGKPGVSDLFFGRVVKHTVFVVTVPVTRAGEIAYFLNASFAPARLDSVLSTQKLPDSWRASIADRSGSVASRTHEIGRFLGKPVNADLLERMGKADEDAFRGRTLEGIPAITVYSRSPLTRWTVTLNMPLSEHTANLRRNVAGLIGATLTALGIAIALALFIGGHIARSITALTGPAKALGAGEPPAIPRLHIREAVEVGHALQEAAALLQEATHASHHDGLTALPNRTLFQILVSQQLALCRRNKTELAILYIDLDGFKAVNDTLGHAAGDALLRAVAQRTRQSIRDSDVAARLGGDEFAVALVDSSLENAKAIAGKLIEAVSEPYPLAGGEARVSACVGIAAYPASATNTDSLLSRADKAMYAAKALGKGRFCVDAKAA